MTKEITIEEMNEAIARFMELEKDINTWRHPYGATVYLKDGYWFPVRKLKYQTDWNWIMPVVQKILNADMDTFDSYVLWVSDSLRTADIKQVHQAVYNYIESKTPHETQKA